MAIYAISDLHLSLAHPKPMDIFGEAWADHHIKIAENWDKIVLPDDTVLIAGDLSWASRLDDARPDLDYIAARPGRKILIRGNHDYWWRRESTNRIQREIDPSISLMQGRAIVIGNTGITGTRGWRLENGEAGDDKVMRRELSYLERGLKEIPENVEHKIALLHYPPFGQDLEPNEFAAMLKAHKVDILIYGHIHSGLYQEGNVNGIEYILASVDHTDFCPITVTFK